MLAVHMPAWPVQATTTAFADRAFVRKLRCRPLVGTQFVAGDADRFAQRQLGRGRTVAAETLALQHLKDVRLILAQGEAAGLPMPLSHAHRAILEEADGPAAGPVGPERVRVPSAMP